VFAGISILLLFVTLANVLAGKLERRLLRWRPQLVAEPKDI
jgi:NitT/TauT family transport system permease protein